MHDALPVRKHFDISATSEPQLELRLHWFGRALAVRRGHIVDVKRRCSAPGEHVASVAYEVPLPPFKHRRSRHKTQAGRASREKMATRRSDEVAEQA
jgi:hypothetical protein